MVLDDMMKEVEQLYAEFFGKLSPCGHGRLQC